MANQRKKDSLEYNKAFPSKLRELFKSSGKTQKEMAAYLHKSAQAISYYCDGSSAPDWETIVEIAKFFSVSTDYLLGRTLDDTPDQTLRSVCKYTGLSSSTVRFLHSQQSDSTELISFYRKLFDSIVRTGEDGLDDVPSHVFDAALARIVSENARRARKESGNYFDMPSSDGVPQITRKGSLYLIPASEAEEYYLLAAQSEISKSLANVIGELEDEVIQALRNDESLTIGGFQWVIDDEDEDEEEADSDGNDNEA